MRRARNTPPVSIAALLHPTGSPGTGSKGLERRLLHESRTGGKTGTRILWRNESRVPDCQLQRCSSGAGDVGALVHHRPTRPGCEGEERVRNQKRPFRKGTPLPSRHGACRHYLPLALAGSVCRPPAERPCWIGLHVWHDATHKKERHMGIPSPIAVALVVCVLAPSVGIGQIAQPRQRRGRGSKGAKPEPEPGFLAEVPKYPDS